jgi:hypothetical protein
MNYALLALGALSGAHAADQQPPVDEDFLEYLGSLDEGDDWALFEDQETKSSTDTRKTVAPDGDEKSASKPTTAPPAAAKPK